MDDVTYDILNKLKLEKVSLIILRDFEDKELLRIKPTRTMVEYFWTISPSLPLYILQRNHSVEMITYLDADLFFYSDPAPIYDELGEKSVLIVEHRFPEQLKYLEVNGIYNVQLLVFRNDRQGMECLKWWRDRCNEWCYYRLEDGKMGDQKYLDDWPVRFKGVHILHHKGAGVALWNIVRYDINKKNGKIFIDDDPLIFYHFHQFNILKGGTYDYGDQGIYSLTAENNNIIYKPYTRAVEETFVRLKKVDPRFAYGYKYIKRDSYLNIMINKMKSAKNRLIIAFNGIKKKMGLSTYKFR
jgi:hypothetical protein